MTAPSPRAVTDGRDDAADTGERSLVRPYTLTRGRTVSPARWPLETVVEAVDPPGRDGRPPGPGPLPEAEVLALASAVRGPVWRPGDPGAEEELASSYGTIVHRPEALVGVRDRDDVVAAVRFAAARGLPVAVQATGHGAVAPVDEGVLISTRRMREVAVDPARRTVRVGAGVVWGEVIDAVAAHGLAPLCGSAPGVGVAGYTLGGGLSPVARTFGFTADHVVAVEVVTADGEVRRADAEHEPELFWGLRGGKGNLGVVTALELEVFPLTALYGGGLFFDGDRAVEVLEAYPAWSARLPERTTTSLAFSRLHAVPGATAPRVHLRVAHLGDRAEGEALLAPMRALGPTNDTVAPMPFTAVRTIHDDPTEPAAVWKRGLLLTDLPAAAVAAIAAATRPDAEDPVASLEIRHLGGALGRRPVPDNAVGGRDAGYGIFIVDLPEPDGSAPPRGQRLVDALAPHSTGGVAINFLGSVTDSDVVATAWDAATYDRLVALKGRLDPHDLLRFGYAVPAGRTPADTSRPAATLGPEARALVELCRPWRSTAELAAELTLPLGVVRVLLSDLLEAGLVREHRPPENADCDIALLERVLRGLHERL